MGSPHGSLECVETACKAVRVRLITARARGQGCGVAPHIEVWATERIPTFPTLKVRSPMGSHAPRTRTKAIALGAGLAPVVAPAAMMAVAGTASAAEAAPVGAYLDENVTYGTPPLEPAGQYLDDTVAGLEADLLDIATALLS
ncbi:MAG: hypothetical protein V7633_5693 [Pseudonocardia sp.]